MDIEKLKEHDLYVLAAIVEGLEEEQSIDSGIAQQFKMLIDAAIARKSATEMATCPDCGGNGTYQEYDEYDRCYVHACGTCDGSGEIARQSVKSEEVAISKKEAGCCK